MTIHRLTCQECDYEDFDESSATLNRLADAHLHPTRIRSFPTHGKTVEFSLHGSTASMKVDDIDIDEDDHKWLGGEIENVESSDLEGRIGDFFQIRPSSIIGWKNTK